MQTTQPTSYADRLRKALTGDPSATFVLIGNFEVEERWAKPHGRLPGAAVKSAAAVVNRMDELALSLTSPRDAVLLKAAPDPGFARHRAHLSLAAPGQTLVCDRNHPERSVTEEALDSPRLLAELAARARAGAWLLPLGTSPLEERLAKLTGMPLALPPSAVFARVNSKIYGRRLVDRLGLRAVPGAEVSSIGELRDLPRHLRDHLDRGGRIVVKEALGVSGKGIVVIDRDRDRRRRRLDQLIALLERRAARTGDDRLELVVERYVDKACDLNYQLVIARDGAVEFDFVKEALTEAGVHKGHVMPSRLDAAQVDELRRAADALGAALHADGYHGVVGVDAILDTQNRLYPVLEINARFNMSTYQTDIVERLVPPGATALARHFNLRLDRQLQFAELERRLGELVFDGDRGLVVNDFAAVNAAAASSTPFDGRLYGLVIGRSRAEAAGLAEQVQRRLDLDPRTDR